MKIYEGGYGADDVWLSFFCGAITGVINPIGGFIYGVIDTYIAVESAKNGWTE